ncbi:hypothetical protein BKA82DRAFT_1003209 [Pisolithus tinctorius]|uniref:Uncharacterized protein n=1 Tax=Pisolithus tinctorius Marx 270 TaxID=870435 RepID=A0A0C3JUZ3_PISTI|nr:hypothetical protein BKA82DRAFT_1003209 [Pisolithus tinctorius]KIO01277.1 hypothetical protein M404DRAFT_1003209 [Pisolithus tinctorius Marx 270]
MESPPPSFEAVRSSPDISSLSPQIHWCACWGWGWFVIHTNFRSSSCLYLGKSILRGSLSGAIEVVFTSLKEGTANLLHVLEAPGG